jgi:hypothetical protein
VGGVGNSQHVRGEAADFIVPGHSVAEVIRWIEQNMDFDQAIDEARGSWIHLSYRRAGGNRKRSFSL